MIASLLQPLAAGVMLASTGPSFPHFAIEQICQSTVTYDRDHKTLHSCRRDERAARDDLMRRWSSIPASYRQSCTGDALSVAPSYVDLKGCIDTCIELAREKAAKRKPDD